MKFSSLLFLCLTTLLIPSVSQAAHEESLDTVYVTTTDDVDFGGPDDNDCSMYGFGGYNCSIRQALKVVANGGAVHIPGGDYCLDPNLGDLEVADKSMTLIGAGTMKGVGTIIGYAPWTKDDGTESSTYLTDCSDESAGDRVFSIRLEPETDTDDYVVELKQIAIANGKAEYYSGADSDYDEGSGILAKASSIRGSAEITMGSNLRIVGNGDGGGVYAYAYSSGRGGTASIAITDQVFVNDNAGRGIVAYASAYSIDAEGSAEVIISDQVTIEDNEGGGLAIYTSDSVRAGSLAVHLNAQVTVGDNVRIEGNTTRDAGGGIYAQVYGGWGYDGEFFEDFLSSITISDEVTIVDNQAGTAGGGIYLSMVTYHGAAGTASFSLSDDVSVTGNTAPDGGGIYARLWNSRDCQIGGGEGWDLSFASSKGVTIKDNQAENDGGGLYLQIYGGSGSSEYCLGNLQVVMEETTFDGNQADSDEDKEGSGGGLYVTLLENTSEGKMPSFDDDYFLIKTANTTFSGNTAYHGGAIAFEDNDYEMQLPVSIYYTTFSDNIAEGVVGGGLYAEFGDFEIISSVFDEAVSKSYYGPECYLHEEVVFNMEYSLMDIEYCRWSDGTIVSVDATNITDGSDPLLDELGDNGGYNVETHALLTDSPALDSGKCLGTEGIRKDQTGSFRNKDGNGDSIRGCDMGSYEKNPGIFDSIPHPF